jgi:hypothetical protein
MRREFILGLNWITVMGLLLFAAFFWLATEPSTVLAVGGGAPLTAISNVEPRKDTKGRILNAHDGGMYEFEGQWVLIGTSYAECESFTNCSSKESHHPAASLSLSLISLQVAGRRFVVCAFVRVVDWIGYLAPLDASGGAWFRRRHVHTVTDTGPPPPSFLHTR